MKSNTRKNRIIASVLAISLLTTGTFAWQAFSQVVTNENITIIDSPGARLHDYFDGVNKDVFVENYATGLNATDVYARIKLSEYFEYGINAGTYDVINPTILRGDIKNDTEPKFGEVDTWDVYSFDSKADEEVENIRTYRDLVTGGEGIYLPTYNLDNESLEPDINGTLTGLTGDGREKEEFRYDDYVEFEIDKAYDQDKVETTDDDAHIALKTPLAAAISMADWIDLEEEDKIGDYWVFDTTGWAYYAKPIPAYSTSGLLLDEITVVDNPQEESYYAIHVTAQMATYGDWGEEAQDEHTDGTGMYEDLTEDSNALLALVSSYDSRVTPSIADEPTEYIIKSIQVLNTSDQELSDEEKVMAVGDELTLKVVVVADDDSQPEEIQGIDWSISSINKGVVDIDSTFLDGIFKPIKGMEGNSYILTAQSQYDEYTSANIVIQILEEDIYAILDLDSRYTYSVLETEELKGMYRELALGYYNREDYIYIGDEYYSIDDISDIIRAVQSDFPEIFWTNVGYSYTVSGPGIIMPKYDYTAEELVTMKEEVYEAEQLYLATLTEGMSDYDIIEHTYRYVADNVTYEVVGEHQSIYGAMVAGVAVCAGYARMFQYLVRGQGVDCTYISGVAYTSTGSENHGWNMVKLEDEYYYVDTTWADGYGTDERYVYYYLMQSYENMKDTHVDHELYAITYEDFGRKYNYAVKNDIRFDDYSVNDIKESWSKMYETGMTLFYLEFTSDETYNEAYTALFANGGVVSILQEVAGPQLATLTGGYNNTLKTLTFFITYSTSSVSMLNAQQIRIQEVQSRFD